jgi:hypothetical protein
MRSVKTSSQAAPETVERLRRARRSRLLAPIRFATIRETIPRPSLQGRRHELT